MRSDTVLTQKKDNYITITLNRPDKLNAFNQAQHLALKAAFDLAAQDKKCRAVLLTGSGRGFCAGQDLGDRDPQNNDEPVDLGQTLDEFYNPLLRQIRSLEIPVVCAVNGVAAGAGANIALACDIVLAAQSAKFIQSFCKIGLVPDCGGTWMLTHLLGQARAKALMMIGGALYADQAESWGLIWKSVADEDLLNTAHDLTAGLAAGATFGLGLTKRAIHASTDNSFEDHLDLERDLQREAGKSPDYREGVSAFLQKRIAKFTGKKPD